GRAGGGRHPRGAVRREPLPFGEADAALAVDQRVSVALPSAGGGEALVEWRTTPVAVTPVAIGGFDVCYRRTQHRVTKNTKTTRTAKTTKKFCSPMRSVVPYAGPRTLS